MNEAWAKFTRRIPVNASLEKVFHCFTCQEGLESWFLRKCRFIDGGGRERGPEEPADAGDAYHFLWHGYSDEQGEHRTILATNHRDEISFGFSLDTRVSIKLSSIQQGTLVELTQDQIPWDEDPEKNLHVQCSDGWTFYLANLKSILEGGVDLRNRDEALQNVINA